MQEPITHSYPLTILESHLDTLGHVNHAIYLQLLEEARWDMVTSRGYGLDRIQKTGLGPVILEVKIEFKRELRLRTKITIETEFKSYKKRIAVIHQRVINPDSKLCAVADIKFGIFDLKKRKLVYPDQEWLTALGLDPNYPIHDPEEESEES